MLARTAILMGLLAIGVLAYKDTSIVAHSGNVYNIGGSQVVFRANVFMDSDFRALISINNIYWAYSVGDTIVTDSIPIILSAIDTGESTVTLHILHYQGNLQQPEPRIGMWEGGYYNESQWTIRIDTVQSNAARITIFTFPATRSYVFDNDTAFIYMDTVMKLKIYEEGIPNVNCRRVEVLDKIHIADHLGFNTWSKCLGSNFASIVGRHYGPSLEISMSYGSNSEAREMLYVSEPYDSTTKLLSPGETWTLPEANITLQLKWVAHDNWDSYAGDSYAGVTYRQSSSVTHKRMDSHRFLNATKANYWYNLLGRRISRMPTRIDESIQLKIKDSGGNTIILGR